MSESLKDALLIKSKHLQPLTISGKPVMIHAFFSMNCLEKFNDYYDQSKDHRASFSKVAFYMYQTTEVDGSKIILTENDFNTSSDEELEAIILSILGDDGNLRDEYEQTQADNAFERFYKANFNLLKNAIAPISKSFANFTKAISYPDTSAITRMMDSYSAMIRAMELPAINSINAFAENYFKGVDFTYFESITKFNSQAMQSIIDGAKRINFNINEIIKPLVSQFEHINMSIQPMISALTDFTSSLDFSLLKYHHVWTEKHDLLVEFGWFYLNELSAEVIEAIYDRKEVTTQAEVDELITQEFRKNRCEKLKKIVNGWNDCLYFQSRKSVLHEALVNHSRRYYNASTTLLSLHIEGIIADFMRIGLQTPKFRAQEAVNGITDYLDDLPMSSLPISDYYIYSEVLERILVAFVEQFDCANPDDTSNNSRHKIAHGHAIEAETEVNSLKRFLYLNELYRLFTFMDKQIDEMNQRTSH